MYLEEHEKAYWAFWQYRLHKHLLLYVPPALLLLGSLGNVLTVVVIVSTKSMWRQSTYLYLAVLACTDLLVLYVGLLPRWLQHLTGHSLIDSADWSCKAVHLAAYVTSDYSGWLVVAVTVERYLAVCRPLRASASPALLLTGGGGGGGRQRAVKVVVVVLVVLLLVNLHFVWTVELVAHETGGGGGLQVVSCEGGPHYKALIDDVWPWVDGAIYSFLPFTIILTLNVLIIRQVVKARRVRQRLQQNNVVGAGGLQYYRARVSAASRPRELPAAVNSMKSVGGRGAVSRRRRTMDSSGRITVMLLLISFLFVALTLPMNCTMVWSRFLRRRAPGVATSLTYHLVWTSTRLLMFLNHAANFILYCATGHKFRQQLRWLFVQTGRKCSSAAAAVCRRVRSSGGGGELVVWSGADKINLTGVTQTEHEERPDTSHPPPPTHGLHVLHKHTDHT